MPTKDSSPERKEANRIYMREHRGRNPEKNKQYQRDHHYQRFFGLSREQYESLLASQNGVCALCHKPETRTRNGELTLLSVDHDHRCCSGRRSCGKCIRKLLCFSCNTLVGRIEANPSLTSEALEYIRCHHG